MKLTIKNAKFAAYAIVLAHLQLLKCSITLTITYQTTLNRHIKKPKAAWTRLF